MNRIGIRSLLGYSFALFILAACTGPLTPSALAQDSDNEAIAAAKKAATLIEMNGFAQVKPTQFFLQVELEAEDKGQVAAQNRLQSLVARTKKALVDKGFQIKNESGIRILFHPKDNPSMWAQVQGVMPTSFSPDETIKAVITYGMVINSAQKAQEAFDVLRATGAVGKVTVYNGLQDDEPARQAALKVAVEHANARAKILNAAAAPKQLDLLFIKQGEFEISETETSADLQSQKPLPLLATINAKTSVVLFYGLKSPAQPATVATKGASAKAITAKAITLKAPQSAVKRPKSE